LIVSTDEHATLTAINNAPVDNTTPRILEFPGVQGPKLITGIREDLVIGVDDVIAYIDLSNMNSFAFCFPTRKPDTDQLASIKDAQQNHSLDNRSAGPCGEPLERC
jgi:hypothetical protein